MTTLAIDIETYSSTDLIKCGVYKYAEAADFQVLMLGFSFDGEPAIVLDLVNNPDQSYLEVIKEHLTDPNVLKTAWNANFERTCLAKHFGIQMPPEQWECSMVRAGMLGLPMSLEACAKVLKLQQQKDTAGKALIRYFSLPCKPSARNRKRTRNLAEHEPEKWQSFIDYCQQDVVTELAIRDKVEFFPFPVKEKLLWNLDQKINDAGVYVDVDFVNSAIVNDEVYENILLQEAKTLTCSENPNSLPQLKSWLKQETGITYKSLNKEVVSDLLANTPTKNVERVLQIRSELSKTSVDKYYAIKRYTCSDIRARGMFQFYGASTTGRWSGRGPQPQNLTKHKISNSDLDLARNIIKKSDPGLLEMLYGDIKNILSQALRTAFVAPPKHRFIVADFSAIEARVIAWVAGEKWRMDVFNTHGKIYEASAAQMFKVPLESVTKGSPLRQKGKVSELALGFQGSSGALIKMGALDMGLIEEELPGLVQTWRKANPSIVKLWYAAQNAAISALEGEPCSIQKGIKFYCEKGLLLIKLPSGRLLSYIRPRLKESAYGGKAVTYEGMNQTSKKWGVQDTYGGKLVENIVQAIARDCLAEAMLRVDAAGYKIIMSVHDEIVIEAPNNFGSLEEVNIIMGEPISWAKGLPLTADSYETNYYKKD